MTDAEHAKAIRKAAEQLDNALDEASKTGLILSVKTEALRTDYIVNESEVAVRKDLLTTVKIHRVTPL